MRTIDEIAERYPALSLEAVRILLTIYQYPGLCIREVADIIGQDPKVVRETIARMADGYNRAEGEGRNWTAFNLVVKNESVCDQRRRDLQLTPTGQELAEQLEVLI